MARHSVIFLRLLAGLLLAAASACGTVAWYGMQRTLPAGLTVDGWPIGAITIGAFEQQLAEQRQRLLGQVVRVVSKQDELPLAPADWTLEQLGLSLPLAEVEAKLRPLSVGSPFERAVYRYGLRGQTWELAPAFDAAKLHDALRRGFPGVYAKEPVDAQRIVGPQDTISYVPDTGVLRIDEPKLLEQLRAVRPTLGALAAVHDGAAADPAPDAAGALQPIATVPLAFYRQNAAVTMQTLKAQGIERKISEFTTTYPANSEGRVHNICSTAASIQDLLLAPGEVFDYAKYIADTEAKFGFKEAPVILNGKLVPGIGGGICQVSSTLYNAVLRAGLEIVERRNHSLPVSYVPLGQDATFASGYINFKFRNSTPYYLLLRTSADESRLTVKLFGQTPTDVTYTIESKTVETLAPPVKYVLNPTLPAGKSKKLTTGKPGYIVETYRYKKQDGQIVGTERISRDTYSAQPTIYESNQGGSSSPTNPAPAPQPGRQPQAPLIEDGVRGPSFP
ncbi:VanW family protein [Paenibacillus sp. TAB 01]|uniref:VanW family protein n=1 Tax=Paenibacillus sp. TAB 01 TaxID=3368988 RepID=UPI003751D9D6